MRRRPPLPTTALAPLIAISLALCSAGMKAGASLAVLHSRRVEVGAGCGGKGEALPPPAAPSSTPSPASLLCSSYPAFIPAGFHLLSRAPCARPPVRHATESRSTAILPASQKCAAVPRRARPPLRQASMAEGGGGAPGEAALGARMRFKGRSRMFNGRGWGARLAVESAGGDVESAGDDGGARGGSTLPAPSSGDSGTFRTALGRQPRGKTIVSLDNSHTNATS